MVYETSGSTDRVTPDQLVSEVLETSLGSGVMSFVETGLTFDPDYGSEELTVTSGVAYILSDGQGLKLTPGETTVPLESGTVNYIYLVKPFTGFEVGYVVKTQDVAPAQSSLKVGTVDTGSNATQELNRGAALSPDKFGNDIDADGNDITNVGTFSSGSTNTTRGIITDDTYHPELIPVSDQTGRNYGSVAYPVDDTEWVCVYRSGTEHGDDNGALLQRRTTDGGVSWIDEGAAVDNSSIDDRNPAGGVLPSGDWILFYMRYDHDTSDFLDMGYRLSSDNGESWSSYTTIDTRGYPTYSPYGKTIETDSGTLLQPIYGEDNSGGAVWVIESTDGGQTWSDKATVEQASTNYPNEAWITRLFDGTLLCISRVTGNQLPQQYYSTDDGNTWTSDGEIPISDIHQGSPTVAPVVWYNDEKKIVEMLVSTRGTKWRAGGSEVSKLIYGYAKAGDVVGDTSAWVGSDSILTTENTAKKMESYCYPFEVDGDYYSTVSLSSNGDSVLHMGRADTFRRGFGSRMPLVQGNRVDQVRAGLIQQVNIDKVVNKSVSNDTAGSYETVDFSKDIPKNSAAVIVSIGVKPDGTPDATSTVEVRPDDYTDANTGRVDIASDLSSGFIFNQVSTTHSNGRIAVRTSNTSNSIIRLRGYKP
ncbi:sialidase [Halovirus HCTV-5]|uniref:sialidase n=1 Tax=Halovirus HCTV-5 TaxID=1273748 RepID=UPI00033483BF|nr:sialidase [Halovirus HCTV-5]AGM11720.1 sialidase [Halovirus HCTV-5]